MDHKSDGSPRLYIRSLFFYLEEKSKSKGRYRRFWKSKSKNQNWFMYREKKATKSVSSLFLGLFLSAGIKGVLVTMLGL